MESIVTYFNLICWAGFKQNVYECVNKLDWLSDIWLTHWGQDKMAAAAF